MGNILYENITSPELKLCAGTVTPEIVAGVSDNCVHIRQSGGALDNSGFTYFFHPDIKVECFRIFTALKNDKISGRVTVRSEKRTIHVIRVYLTQDITSIIVEECCSKLVKRRNGGWYIDEKEI